MKSNVTKSDDLLKLCLTKLTAKSLGKNNAKLLNSNAITSVNNDSPNLDTNQATLNTASPKRPGGKGGGGVNTLLSREATPTYTTSAQKSSVVTSKIIELLNRKSVASNVRNFPAQSSSNSSSQARKPSALETLLTAPMNGYIKEALIPEDHHYQPLVNGTASERHRRPKSTALRAPNNRKESSRSSKGKRVSETTNSEAVPCSSANPTISTYQVNGTATSDDLDSERSKLEAAMVAQKWLNLKKVANLVDVGYQLEEYDDDDEGVLPLVIKGSVMCEVEDGESVFRIKRLPSYERASIVTSCFDEVCLPNNEQLSLRIMDTAARFDLKFAHQNVVPLLNARLRVI